MPVGRGGHILLPEQEARDALALQFAMDDGEIRRSELSARGRRRRAFQQLPQGRFSQFGRQGPAEAARLGELEIFVDDADRKVEALGDLSLRKPGGVET